MVASPWEGTDLSPWQMRGLRRHFYGIWSLEKGVEAQTFSRCVVLLLVIKSTEYFVNPVSKTEGKKQSTEDIRDAWIFSTLNVEPPGPDLTLRCSII
jgi:hypothetical protein